MITALVSPVILANAAVIVPPVPPVNLSIIVVPGGNKLRWEFDRALSVADLAGLSWSDGTMLSGTINGKFYDVTIAMVYQDAEVGTGSYDGLGVLAGTRGAVAAFGPVTIDNQSTQVPAGVGLQMEDAEDFQLENAALAEVE